MSPIKQFPNPDIRSALETHFPSRPPLTAWRLLYEFKTDPQVLSSRFLRNLASLPPPSPRLMSLPFWHRWSRWHHSHQHGFGADGTQGRRLSLAWHRPRKAHHIWWSVWWVSPTSLHPFLSPLRFNGCVAQTDYACMSTFFPPVKGVWECIWMRVHICLCVCTLVRSSNRADRWNGGWWSAEIVQQLICRAFATR